MSSQRTQEVLYETEAALRLVDHGLLGLRDETRDGGQTAAATDNAAINVLDTSAASNHDACVRSVGR